MLEPQRQRYTKAYTSKYLYIMGEGKRSKRIQEGGGVALQN